MDGSEGRSGGIEKHVTGDLSIEGALLFRVVFAKEDLLEGATEVGTEYCVNNRIQH